MNKPLAESVYERLVDEEDARVCRDISEAACRETPANFMLTLLAQFLTKLGDALASPKVTLAWVLGAIQAPLGLTALLVPIRESGSLVPQLLIASYVRRLPLRKRVWVAGSVIQAVAIAAMGVVALTLTGAAAGWSLIPSAPPRYHSGPWTQSAHRTTTCRRASLLRGPRRRRNT